MALFALGSPTDVVQHTQQIISDTLQVAIHGEEGVQQGGNWIIEHVSNSREIALQPFGTIHLPQFAPLHLGNITLDLSITKHVVFLWLASVILIVVLSIAARRNSARRAPHGFGNLIDVIVVYIRDEIVLPTIGKEGLRLLPFLLTLFFFILTCNLLGVLPYGSTATGNVSVTAALAVISFVVIQISGVIRNGFFGYFKGLIPQGVPIFVLPVMIIVEFIGLFTKPFALCIRLFANMTAGHVVILGLIGLIFVFKSLLIAPVSIVFVLFIDLLELFIALLQAYVFTMLSSLFIAMAIHQEH